MFGPHPRSYEQAMPRKARREALREALSDKVASGELTVVERIAVQEPKTKALVSYLSGLGINGQQTLMVVAERGEVLMRASRNIPWLTVETPKHISVYQLLRVERLLAERAALSELEVILGAS